MPAFQSQYPSSYVLKTLRRVFLEPHNPQESTDFHFMKAVTTKTSATVDKCHCWIKRMTSVNTSEIASPWEATVAGYAAQNTKAGVLYTFASVITTESMPVYTTACFKSYLLKIISNI